MFQKAVVPLVADRWTAFSHVVRFVGVDLTDATHALQVRDTKDQGSGITPRASLAKTTTAGAEGIRLVDVTTEGGVPTSEFHIVIAKATMAAMDMAADSGKPGDDGAGWYDWHIATPTAIAFMAMQGSFRVAAGATVSSLTDGTSGGNSVTVIQVADNGTTIVVSSADVLSAATVAALGEVEAARVAALAAVDDGKDTALVAVAAATEAAEAAKDEATEQAGIATTEAAKLTQITLTYTIGAGAPRFVLGRDANGKALLWGNRHRVRHPQIDAMYAITTALEPLASSFTVEAGAPKAVLRDSAQRVLSRQTRSAMVHPQISADRRMLYDAVERLDYVTSQLGNTEYQRLLGMLTKTRGSHGHGQSLSVAAQGVPPYSFTAIPYSRMFTDGVIPHADGVTPTYGAMTAHVEEGVETYLAAFVRTMAQLYQMRLGIDLASISDALFFVSTAGQGSTAIDGLDKGEAAYTRLMAHVTNAKLLLNAAGNSYVVREILWAQGEQDYSANTSRSTYDTEMRTLADDLDIDIRALTGQSETVRLISSQVATNLYYSRTTPTIGLAQVDAMANAKVGVAFADYAHEYTSDRLHHTPRAYMQMGAMFAKYAFEWDAKAVRPSAFAPIRAERRGTRDLALVYPIKPGQQMVIDAAGKFPGDSRNGVDPVTSGGSVVTVGSMWAQGDSIVLRFADQAARDSVAKVRVAWRGPSDFGASNIRNNAGDRLILLPGEINHVAHDWALQSETEVI